MRGTINYNDGSIFPDRIELPGVNGHRKCFVLSRPSLLSSKYVIPSFTFVEHARKYPNNVVVIGRYSLGALVQRCHAMTVRHAIIFDRFKACIADSLALPCA
ncbi:MAG: hypothetical protein ACI96P_000987 [Candidatus Azotimanducaceae bacterium]|jgi:hypothetical protein